MHMFRVGRQSIQVKCSDDAGREGAMTVIPKLYR